MRHGLRLRLRLRDLDRHGATQRWVDAAVSLTASLDEYRKYVETDAALERRFQPIQVGEPSLAHAIEILKGLRGRYEAHHRVSIARDRRAVPAGGRRRGFATVSFVMKVGDKSEVDLHFHYKARPRAA